MLTVSVLQKLGLQAIFVFGFLILKQQILSKQILLSEKVQAFNNSKATIKRNPCICHRTYTLFLKINGTLLVFKKHIKNNKEKSK